MSTEKPKTAQRFTKEELLHVRNVMIARLVKDPSDDLARGIVKKIHLQRPQEETKSPHTSS